MNMHFVREGSIVRKIWGKTDVVLFIFAAASAEFALNKAVDWLYHTGKLPADPLGRLFSTVNYAQQIIFSAEKDALFAIKKINAIHSSVEANRQSKIPNRAYQDVLYMLIDYSIRAYELLERKLALPEKEEIYAVFKKVGQQMRIDDLPPDYERWKIARKNSLETNYYHCDFTTDLFLQYKKHLGVFRFWLLKQVQAVMVPDAISRRLKLRRSIIVLCLFYIYKMSRFFMLNGFIIELFIPPPHKQQVHNLTHHQSTL